MRKITLYLVFLVLTIFLLTQTTFAFSAGHKKPLPINSRSFKMGFIPIPKQPLTTEAWLDAFDLLGKNADFVLSHAHIDWDAFVNTVDAESSKSIESLNFISGMAERENLQLFVVIDPLSREREKIDQNLPRSLGTNFGDAKVRRAFKNFSVRVARDYKPVYMGLGSEVNSYILRHPDDAENFISLYKETYQLVKEQSPNTKITTTFQFESLSGTFKNNPHWEMIQLFEPYLDLVGITTYPSLSFGSPEEIPSNYYSQIKAYTDKPIIVAESGWPTDGAGRYHGSKEGQEKFLLHFVELTRNIDLELWVWWFLHDWAGSGYADFFKTMGLRKADGRKKPAWKIWQQIFNLPR